MNELSPQPAKRPRLSLACNECRRRKVKCDARYPKCRNCQTRNSECITTDLRRLGVEVTREWVELPDQPSPSTHDGTVRTSYSVTTSHQSIRTPGPSIPAELPQPNPANPAIQGSSDNIPVNTDISQLHQAYHMPLVREHTTGRNHITDRVKLLGGSSSQSLTRSLDVYLKSAHIDPVSSGFRHGMRFVEEMEVPLILSLPPLPPIQKCELYLDTFFRRIGPLYPIFEGDTLREGVQKLAMMPKFDDLPHEEVPMLASAYLIMSLCADEQAQRYTEEGLSYLHAAAGLFGHVVLIPYLMAVQTLLLFTVCFRGRNKDGVGWRALAMAIRISQTLGLHRNSTVSSSTDHRGQYQGTHSIQARIWAICCSLEKVMQLEVGWPSMIKDFDYNQLSNSTAQEGSYDFLNWHMGLARIQGHISHHINGHSPGDRSSKDILQDTIRLDRALVSWAHQIPEEFRPGNDLFVASHEFHITAFLSIQYHQTMISLHRAALVSPVTSFRAEVDLYCAENPSKMRIQSGEAICVSSARSIANLAIELMDRNIESRIINAGPFLLACVTLGISLVKNPGRRMQATDLELLKACVDYTANQYNQSGQHPGFVQGIRSIYKQVHLHVLQKPQASSADTLSQLHSASNGHQNSHELNVHNGGSTSDHPIYTNGEAYHHSNNTSNSTFPSIHNIIHPNTDSSNALINSSTQQSHGLIGRSTYGQVEVRSGVNESMGIAPEEYDLSSSHGVSSEIQPFGNLSVEEIWNWMMVSGLDNQSLNEGA